MKEKFIGDEKASPAEHGRGADAGLLSGVPRPSRFPQFTQPPPFLLFLTASHSLIVRKTCLPYLEKGIKRSAGGQTHLTDLSRGRAALRLQLCFLGGVVSNLLESQTALGCLEVLTHGFVLAQDQTRHRGEHTGKAQFRLLTLFC